VVLEGYHPRQQIPLPGSFPEVVYKVLVTPMNPVENADREQGVLLRHLPGQFLFHLHFSPHHDLL
jgi:hypothetical protein